MATTTTPPAQPAVPEDPGAGGGDGDGNDDGEAGADGTAAANTEPQFGPDTLAGIAFVLFLAVLVAVLLVVNDPTTTGHTSTVTTTRTEAGETTTETVRQVLNTPFATDMARILALGGVATIAMGAWLQAASLRKWRVPVTTRTDDPGGLGARTAFPVTEVLTTVGETIAKVKPPVALVFAGFALLLAAGWIAVETLPARAEPAEATTEQASESPSDPAATPGPTASPTTSPSAPATPSPTPSGPATGDDPLPSPASTG